MRRPFALPDLIERSQQQWSERIFIEDKRDALTYAEFRDAMLRSAAVLRAHGIGPGDRVGIFLEKSPFALFAIFGASAAGAVFVNIHPSLKSLHVAHIVKDCEMRAIFVSRQTLKQLGEDALALIDRLTVFVVGDYGPQDKRAGRLPFGKLLGETAAVPRPVPRLPRDVAALLYTSGSTGLPKGVIVAHETLVDGAFAVADYLALDANDRVYAVLPLSFDYGFNQITSSAAVGCTAVLGEFLFAGELIRNLRCLRITGLAGTPVIWTSVSEYFMQHAGEPFPPLRYMTNSGGAIPEKHVRHLVDVIGDTRFYLMYGLTEAFRSTFLPPEEVKRRPTSIGKPVPGVEIYLLDPQGRPVGVGEPGELVHRGLFVNLGYYNRPQDTAKVYRPNPLALPGVTVPDTVVYSGDLVRRDEEGYLYFVERNNNMIKIRGFRISPEEIERVLNAVPGIALSAVTSRPNNSGDHEIVAFLAPEQNSAPEALCRRAMTEIRGQLPAHMLPAEVVCVEAIPANTNNKIDRARLKQLAAEHAPAPATRTRAAERRAAVVAVGDNNHD